MSTSPDREPTPAAEAVPPAAKAEHGPTDGGHRQSRGMAASVWVLEHTQDVVTVLIGAVLLLLAGALLVSGIIEFLQQTSHGISVLTAATALLDRALFVLILIEIVHTVVLSLQAHRLIAQPFVVVGLVAVIRRILLLLSASEPPDPTELGLLIAMVAVFVAGLITISIFEGKGNEQEHI